MGPTADSGRAEAGNRAGANNVIRPKAWPACVVMKRTFNRTIHQNQRPVTEAFGQRSSHAYERWGKGVHLADLNFCERSAYASVEECALALLFIGEDFSRTSIVEALSRP